MTALKDDLRHDQAHVDGAWVSADSGVVDAVLGAPAGSRWGDATAGPA